MIIKGKGLKTGLVGIKHEKDNVIFTHRAEIEGILKRAFNLRKGGNNGFTDNREMRHIGEIPEEFFVMHPEWNNHPELIKDWLNKDEVGRMFRACAGRI